MYRTNLTSLPLPFPKGELTLSQVNVQESLFRMSFNLSKCPTCSSHKLEHITRSSKYALQKKNKPEKVAFMKCCKVGGTFSIPKAMTLYRKKIIGVTKAEILFARSVSGTCQYPFRRSHTEPLPHDRHNPPCGKGIAVRFPYAIPIIGAE